MYWVSGNDSVYVANLDGSERRLFLRVANGRFDGSVLDVRRDRFVFRSLIHSFTYSFIQSFIHPFVLLQHFTIDFCRSIKLIFFSKKDVTKNYMRCILLTLLTSASCWSTGD